MKALSRLLARFRWPTSDNYVLANNGKPGRNGVRTETFASFVAVADKSRDQRLWAEAANSYASALAIDEAHPHIWVQYGHALKESGQPILARDAYSEALKQEPRNSDTALQMGHVLKIIGDRDEAANWYLRAAIGCPPQLDGWRELKALDVSGKILQRSVDVSNLSKRDHKTIVLDIGPSRDDQASSGIFKNWYDVLAKAIPYAEDLSILRLFRPGYAERWSFPMHPPAFVVVSPRAEDTVAEISYTLDSVWISGSVPIVNLLGLSEWFNMGLWLGNREIAILDACIARSAFIIVTNPIDAEIVEGRSRLLGSHSRTIVLAFSERQPGNSNITRHQAAPIGLLAPSCSQMTAHMLNVCRVHSESSIFFIREGQSGQPFHNIDMRISSELLNYDRIRDLSGVVIPADYPNSDAVIVTALEFGVPVLVEPVSRLSLLFGDLINYVDFSNQEALGKAIGSLSAHVLPAIEEGQRWGNALANVLSQVNYTPSFESTLLGQKRAKLGHFIDLAGDRTDSVVCNRMKLNSEQFLGFSIASSPLRLTVYLEEICLEPWRLAILVGADLGISAVDIALAARDKRIDEHWQVPVEGWGWIVIELDEQEFGGMSEISMSIACSIRSDAQHASSEAFVGGLIVYPVSKDYLWFEMLDRASRGLEPSLRSVSKRAMRSRGV